MVTVPCWCTRCAGNRWSLNVASHMVWAGQCPCTAQMHTVVSAQSLCTVPVRQTSLTVPLAPSVIKSKYTSARFGPPPRPLFIAVHTNLKTRRFERWERETISTMWNCPTYLYNWQTFNKSMIFFLSLGNTFYISLILARHIQCDTSMLVTFWDKLLS